MKLNKTEYNAINYFIYILIILEIYLLYKYNSSLEVSKLRLIQFFKSEFELHRKVIIISILSFVSISFYICYLYKINIISYFILVILFLILSLEYQLIINKHIYKKEININKLYETCNTGDIILYDIPYKIPDITHTIPTYFFGMSHIGIIYKSNNKIYLLECDYNNNNYCNFSKKRKNGIALLKLEDRININENRTFFVKTNFHNYLNNKTIINFIEKYKDVSYMENNFNCITTVIRFFKEANLLKDKNINIFLYVYYKTIFDKNFYNFPFEYEIYKLK
jgi:hypothetical protein